VLTGCLEAQLEKKEEIDSTSDSIEENSGENDSGQDQGSEDPVIVTPNTPSNPNPIDVPAIEDPSDDINEPEDPAEPDDPVVDDSDEDPAEPNNPVDDDSEEDPVDNGGDNSDDNSDGDNNSGGDAPVDTFDARSSVLPTFSSIADVFVDHKQDEDLDFVVPVDNAAQLNGFLHWSKDYGPDDLSIHPETGRVEWNIPNDMPSESFHVGVKVSNSDQTIRFSFIVHAGVDTVVTVGAGGDHPSIKSAISALPSGGTVVVLDGEYTGDANFMGLTSGGAVNHPPSGTATAFTTLMAKNPGQAILKDGAYIRLNGNWPVSYVAFKGFFVIDGQIAAFGYGKNKTESNLRHHHLKFIRNGVQGDDRLSPFNAFRSDDVIFENNYAFGGGRYKFASYQAENIVMRRNVARYDRGTYEGEPKGTYSVYTTMNGYIANNLAIDGDSPDFVTQGELAGEFTTPTTSGNTRATFVRNMQINSAFLFGNMDDQVGDSDVEHKDVVSWDVRPESRYIMTWGSAWFDHMTLGNIQPRQFVDQYFNGYHNNTRGITNSILHNFNDGNMFYSLRQADTHETVGRTVERFGVDTVNITEFDGSLVGNQSDIQNVSDHVPLYSAVNTNGGLRYLTRIEKGSNLSGQAKDGGDLGATVMTFSGKSGTFHGEDGYDVETGIPMWPFPMEQLIKEKFAAYSYTGNTYTGHYTSRTVSGTGSINGARGFAVEGQSLTNYIWEYLGTIAPPLNITVTPESDAALIQWDQHQSISDDQITGYNVYFYNDVTDEKTLIANVPKELLHYRLENLSASTSYQVIVTTVTSDEESSFSYPISFTTL